MDVRKHLLYLKLRSRGRVLQLILEEPAEAERGARHLGSYFETFVDDIAEVVEWGGDSAEELRPEFESYEAFTRHYWY